MPRELIESATMMQAQRLDQLMRLNKQFDTAQSHADMDVTITNQEGSFRFHLDNHQRSYFYNMLRGRLRSMPWEGLGNIGWELLGGRIHVP